LGTFGLILFTAAERRCSRKKAWFVVPGKLQTDSQLPKSVSVAWEKAKGAEESEPKEVDLQL